MLTRSGFVEIGIATVALAMGACTGEVHEAPSRTPDSIAAAANATEAERERSFTLFESGQVRPLAMSPNGRTLFAANTPDNRVEVFRTTRDGLRHCGSVVVGLEPVALAARTNNEVWVVNHVSDSVSIVRINPFVCPRGPGAGLIQTLLGRVTRTLLVGDEPRDIVFAGSDGSRAFITTAHRGQNTGMDPQLSTPGIGRADVWVFDADDLGAPLTGTPLNVITLFTDTPRALAVSADGGTVYAAGFMTGNQTTAVHEEAVTESQGLPGPRTDVDGVPQLDTSLIVKFNGTNWVDTAGRIWDSLIRFSLPDTDVFAIDANANPPAEVASFAHVGTTLFNMAVNPVSGNVYVSNLEANNLTRFEGPGVFGGSTVRGNIVQSRITVLGGNGPEPRHLNKHIDYSQCCAPLPNDENARSLAFPVDMQVSSDGEELYVAAFGSGKVGVFDTEELEDDSFVPDTDDQIQLSGGGPSGLVLDEDRDRLYVLTRFNNSISIVDIDSKEEIGTVAMYNPEPESVVAGRPFLYDAARTSAHGDSACASCHIFGDTDHLAWDLGNPDETTLINENPFSVTPAQLGFPDPIDFFSLKGPMATQSLRGMANHGPMHWRGDRTGGLDEPSAQPDDGAFDEDAAFRAFNGAFAGLLGRSEVLTDAEMQAFTDFALQITYPPNPIRNLDDSETPLQALGRSVYFSPDPTDTVFNCNGCHVLDPAANAEFGVAKPGFFGTDGRSSFENEAQIFKIPHMRNLYQKVGMFGMPRVPFFLPEDLTGNTPNAFTGPQVRGFGFLHDGSTDTVFRFVQASVFLQRPPGTLGPMDPGNLTGLPVTEEGFLQRAGLEAFLLAYPSNMKPIVGQQVTLRNNSPASVTDRVALLKARADAGDCDLVASRRGRSYLYDGNGLWRSDLSFLGPLPDSFLTFLTRLPGGEITYTCAPPENGVRIALDRDLDGFFNGDERLFGTDGADPNSRPF